MSFIAPPFNMLIIGPTFSGKSYFLLKFLEKHYKRYFSYIFLICPTFRYNKTFLKWKYLEDENFIAIDCKQEQVDECLRFIVEFCKGTKSCIILDDVAASNDVKQRSNELVDLAFSSRHYDISVIVLTQKLTSISLLYRENVGKVIYFYSPNLKSKKILFEEFMEHVENKEELFEKLKDKKYNYLDINMRYPYNWCLKESE